jgi:predicted CXXCH cytochrome family protein
MKINRSIVTLGGAALLVGISGMAHAGIANTKHNLSSSGAAAGNTIYADDGGAASEICVFCHTPHAATVASANNTLPLWNRNVASAAASYAVYSSTTLNAVITNPGGLDTADTATISNLCLSCHDGTVAIASVNNPSNNWDQATMYGDMVGLTADKMPAGNTNLGTDLANDHPINFIYDDVADVDSSIYAEADAETNGARFFGQVAGSKTMQCASCHDPHTESNAPFLRVSPVGSDLCLACHNK